MRKDLRKLESAILLGLLLLPGLLIALPAISAIGVSAYSGTPSVVTGATISIDYPILASIATSGAVSRVISVYNPPGNPGITTITVSVPTAAVTATPTGSIPIWGGVPDCAATACSAQVFGSGPYSIQYTDNKTPGAVILPPGAAISLVIGLTPETSTSATGAADVFQLQSSVTDTGGANTVLNTMSIYETTTSQITVSTPSSSQSAGVPFTFTALASQSGLPLVAGVTTGTASTTTISPSSFTSSSSAQTISVNDTTAESLVVQAGGAAPNPNSAGGFLTNGTVSVTVAAGAVTQLSIFINGYDSTHQINMTSTSLLSGANVAVSTTDKYGNPAPFSSTSATTVTLAASTLKGQAAGFTTATAFGSGTSSATYPYTPSDIAATTTVVIAVNADTALLSSASLPNFYFGPDYGSASQITASAGGLPGAYSSQIVTWALQTGAPTMAVSPTSLNVAAGSAATISATLPTIEQAGIPVYFSFSTNSSGYAGTFSNGQRTVTQLTTANSTMATAIATLNVDTTLNSTAVIAAYYALSPTANSSSSVTGTIKTVEGPFASLTVNAYFDSAQTQTATATTSGGTLFIDAVAADSYGNTLTVPSGTLQVTLSTTAGKLSATTTFITAGQTDLTGSNYQVQFTAPTSGTFTITAVGTYNGLSATGSITLSVVSAAPTVTFVTVPASVTTGVPQTITGWANVSAGIPPATITKLEYSLNGGSEVTLGSGLADNQFSITILLSTSNTINVTATDSNSVSTSAIVQIPPVALINSTSFVVTPYLTTLGQFKAINATLMNNTPSPITAIVFAVVSNSAGQIVYIGTATTTLSSLGEAMTFPIITGLQSGTYSVNVFVWTSQGVPISTPVTISVTL